MMKFLVVCAFLFCLPYVITAQAKKSKSCCVRIEKRTNFFRESLNKKLKEANTRITSLGETYEELEEALALEKNESVKIVEKITSVEENIPVARIEKLEETCAELEEALALDRNNSAMITEGFTTLKNSLPFVRIEQLEAAYGELKETQTLGKNESAAIEQRMDELEKALALEKKDSATFIKEITTIKETMEKILALEKNEHTAIVAEMTTMKKRLADAESTIKTTASPIVFLVQGIADVTREQPIKFKTEMYNYGQGYNIKTGIFTAPIAGSYMFTVHTCNAENTYSCHALYKNNVVLTRGAIHSDPYSTCAGITVTVVLKAGETMSVKHNCPYPNFFANIHRTNYFSGALLNALDQ